MQEMEHCPNCSIIFNPDHGQILYQDSCPSCRIRLSKKEKTRPFQKPLFVKASKIVKISLGIDKLDSIIPFLSLNQIVLIIGVESQKILERLCIRSQLPQRHGGLDSKAVVVDCANSTDLYLCVDYARRHGLDPTQSLSNIVTARAFTIHQICNLVDQLPETIPRHHAKLVIISGLLDMFSDPYLDKKESGQILEHIMNKLSKIKDCLIIVSITENVELDKKIFKNISQTIRITKECDHLNITTGNSEKTITMQDLV